MPVPLYLSGVVNPAFFDLGKNISFSDSLLDFLVPGDFCSVLNALICFPLPTLLRASDQICDSPHSSEDIIYLKNL